jgi:hypothetical protein
MPCAHSSREDVSPTTCSQCAGVAVKRKIPTGTPSEFISSGRQTKKATLLPDGFCWSRRAAELIGVPKMHRRPESVHVIQAGTRLAYRISDLERIAAEKAGSK